MIRHSLRVSSPAPNAALEGSLSGRRIALFGSYGWGDGQWMRDWRHRCRDAGACLLEENGLRKSGRYARG